MLLFILYHIYILCSSDIFIYIFIYLYRYLHVAVLPVEESDISTWWQKQESKFSAMLKTHSLIYKRHKSKNQRSGKMAKTLLWLQLSEASTWCCVTLWILRYLGFLLQKLCKCSVSNGVINSPRNHQAVYRQLPWTWTRKQN